jgi:hypothetical protein
VAVAVSIIVAGNRRTCYRERTRTRLKAQGSKAPKAQVPKVPPTISHPSRVALPPINRYPSIPSIHPALHFAHPLHLPSISIHSRLSPPCLTSTFNTINPPPRLFPLRSSSSSSPPFSSHLQTSSSLSSNLPPTAGATCIRPLYRLHLQQPQLSPHLAPSARLSEAATGASWNGPQSRLFGQHLETSSSLSWPSFLACAHDSATTTTNYFYTVRPPSSSELPQPHDLPPTCETTIAPSPR